MLEPNFIISSTLINTIASPKYEIGCFIKIDLIKPIILPDTTKQPSLNRLIDFHSNLEFRLTASVD